MHRFLLGGSAIAALLACGCNGGKDNETDGSGTGSAEIRDVTCTPGSITGVAEVTWATALGGNAQVVYGTSESDLSLSAPEVEASAGAVTLVGLQLATPHFAKVVIGDQESELIECAAQIPSAEIQGVNFNVETWNPELACEDGGYVLLSFLGNGKSGVGFVDRDGEFVWVKTSPDPGVQFTRARLGRDGKSVLWNTNDTQRTEDIATIERLSVDGSESTSTRTINGHHDFVELPDGTLAWLSYEFGQAAVEGLPSYPDPDDIAVDSIYEAPEGITDANAATKIFDMFEDWPGGLYLSGSEMENCETGFIPGYCEFSHGNSLAYVDSQDAFYGGFRWLDAISKIDRSTGNVLWTLGGPNNSLQGDPADLPVRAHFSDIWAGGMLIFDNRADGEVSRVVEYKIDEEAGTYELVWEYPSERHEAVLGDARRMPIAGCDNVLVSWSSRGIIEELTQDGQTVWKIALGIGAITSRVQYTSSLYDFAEQSNPGSLE